MLYEKRRILALGQSETHLQQCDISFVKILNYVIIHICLQCTNSTEYTPRGNYKYLLYKWSHKTNNV